MKLFLAVAALTAGLCTALTSVSTEVADPTNAVAVSCKLGPNEFCGDLDMVSVGNYVIYQIRSFTDGTGCQCTVATKISDSIISWVTKFTWRSSNLDVKTYHSARNEMPIVSLGKIQSLSTTVSYSLTYKGAMTGTVGYSLSGYSSKGSISIDVKVVLAMLGDMQPSLASGKVLIEKVTLGDVKFKLFYTWERNFEGYTFVANQTTTSFTGNLVEFYKTISNLSIQRKNDWSAYSLSSSDYLANVMFGIDVVDAINGVMNVSTYSTNCTLVDAM